jgi:hypothetical protein
MLSFNQFIIESNLKGSKEWAHKALTRLAKKQGFGAEYVSNRLSDAEQTQQIINSKRKRPGNDKTIKTNQSIPIASLRPSQKGVETDRVRHYIDNPEQITPIRVSKTGDDDTKPKVADGHHRRLAKRLLGKKTDTIDAEVSTWYPNKKRTNK